MLEKESIIKMLKTEYKNVDIHIHDVIDSTNTEAKRLAETSAKHGTTIFADMQKQGRGRLGRSFFSPNQTGIYMTILLKAKEDMSQTVLITTAASVAVARAIKNICQMESQIKWVNDIYINEKKICGILAEAVNDVNTGMISHIALGIGINMFTPNDGFPEDLKDKAGTIFDNRLACEKDARGLTFSREALAAKIINQVLDIYEHIDSREFIHEYRERSMVLGKDVDVVKHYQTDIENATKIKARVTNIDDDGGLVVAYEDGAVETLNTGEISIRW